MFIKFGNKESFIREEVEKYLDEYFKNLILEEALKNGRECGLSACISMFSPMDDALMNFRYKLVKVKFSKPKKNLAKK